MMKEQIIDRMNDPDISPSDFITLMFERTDEDGILYIPDLFDEGYGAEDRSYKCRVNWNLSKYEKVLEKFEKLYKSLQKIAPYWDELHDAPQNARAILKDTRLFDVWCTYVRPFEIGNIDYQKICDIDDRYDTMELVQNIASELAKGNRLSESDRHLLTEYMDVKVSKAEEAYYKRYIDAVQTDAKSRVNDNICAYSVVARAMRLCRLLNLRAPKVVVKNDAKNLAAAMVLNEYGISKETVGNSVRLHIERLEQMSDEELDEYYKPRKANSRKSMAPLFVYSILKSKSNSQTHLRQQDILNELAKYPYELTIERKALSRLIHNLIDTPQYAVFSDKTGVWIEQE